MGTIAMMGLKWHYSRTFQRSLSFKILRIHIGTFGDENFNDFRVTFPSLSRETQRSHFMLILHICAGSQVLFDYFDVSSFGGIMN
mgnify:CR=1 FL=1